MYLLRRNPNLNIALKTGALGVRLALTLLEQYGWSSILRACNLSCLAVPLYSVFDIPALFCPLWLLSCGSLDDFIVPGPLPPGLLPPCGLKWTLCHKLHLPPPSHSPVSPSLTQTSLSLWAVCWIPYSEPPLFLKWIQPPPPPWK